MCTHPAPVWAAGAETRDGGLEKVAFFGFCAQGAQQSPFQVGVTPQRRQKLIPLLVIRGVSQGTPPLCYWQSATPETRAMAEILLLGAQL